MCVYVHECTLILYVCVGMCFVCVHTVEVKKKFPFRLRTTVVQRCCVLKKTVQKRSMNGTVAFLLTVLLHVYMMKRFPLPST